MHVGFTHVKYIAMFCSVFYFGVGVCICFVWNHRSNVNKKHVLFEARSIHQISGKNYCHSSPNLRNQGGSMLFQVRCMHCCILGPAAV